MKAEKALFNFCRDKKGPQASIMLTVGHGRAAEAGSSPRQQLMGKASPRGSGGTRHGFSRVGSNKYSEAAAEARQSRPLLRPPNTVVEGTKLDISPPAMQPLSRAGYARHGTRVAANTTTPRRGGAAEASRRGRPLAEWMWPSNESASSIANTGECLGGEAAAGVNQNTVSPVSPASLDEPLSVKGLVSAAEVGAGKRPIIMPHQQARPSIVVGKVCEPIRPTRLDLSSASEGAWYLCFCESTQYSQCPLRSFPLSHDPVLFPKFLCANCRGLTWLTKSRPLELWDTQRCCLETCGGR